MCGGRTRVLSLGQKCRVWFGGVGVGVGLRSGEEGGLGRDGCGTPWMNGIIKREREREREKREIYEDDAYNLVMVMS